MPKNRRLDVINFQLSLQDCSAVWRDLKLKLRLNTATSISFWGSGCCANPFDERDFRDSIKQLQIEARDLVAPYVLHFAPTAESAKRSRTILWKVMSWVRIWSCFIGFWYLSFNGFAQQPWTPKANTGQYSVLISASDLSKQQSSLGAKVGETSNDDFLAFFKNRQNPMVY